MLGLRCALHLKCALHLHAVAEPVAFPMSDFSRHGPPLANLRRDHRMHACFVRDEHERTSRIMRNIRRVDERLMHGLIQRFAIEQLVTPENRGDQNEVFHIGAFQCFEVACRYAETWRDGIRRDYALGFTVST